MPEEPGPPPAQLVEFVRSLGPVGRALDLGCGDGRLSAELQATELTLADVSPLALERAQRRLPDARVQELEPDAPLPFGDGEFDLVLCAETLEHVRDVQLLLSEARRVLRTGGTLAITTPANGGSTAMGCWHAASRASSTRSRPTFASSRAVRSRACWASSASRWRRCDATPAPCWRWRSAEAVATRRVTAPVRWTWPVAPRRRGPSSSCPCWRRWPRGRRCGWPGRAGRGRARRPGPGAQRSGCAG